MINDNQSIKQSYISETPPPKKNLNVYTLKHDRTVVKAE